LLVTIAQRLQSCLRSGDTVARLGGDEFTFLLEDIDGMSDVTAVADRITGQLLTPVHLEGREVFTMGSLGIAFSACGAEDAHALLRDADTAMYQAKTEGKSRCVVFDHSMNTHAVERLELETDLHRALDHGEFQLHYQPIIHLETGQIREVEALVRWEHPKRGLIPPSSSSRLRKKPG
jgi:predicted signal transduction protein with EAL and GGDEF domain